MGMPECVMSWGRKPIMRLFPASGAVALLILLAFWPATVAWAEAPTLPAGTVLNLHLQAAISTKTSKQGQATTANLAREVDVPGGIALPYGSFLTGTIEKCVQPTAADQRAALLLSFGQLTIPNEGTFPVQGHLTEVSNGRETLLADGTITGVLESEAPVSMLGGVLQKLGGMNPTVNDQIEKQKIGQVNTAIEFPAGTDIQFTLSAPLILKHVVASAGPGQLPANLRASVQNVLADAPKRAVNKMNRPGDPINLVFIGTAQEIEQAFTHAGWMEPKKKNQQSVWKTAQAVMNNDGYGAAPVSDLFLFGHKEDLAFEKTLNTFNKRHHLRLWQAPGSAPDGRPIWLGAATHDIGLDIHPGVVSHATDPNLDDERAQVGADLFLAGDVEAADLVAPPNPLSSGMTATGGAWHTDGRVIVIEVKPGSSTPL